MTQISPITVVPMCFMGSYGLKVLCRAYGNFVCVVLWLTCSSWLYGPRQANLVLIACASSEGSGEPAHPRSLARTFAARSYKQWVKRNLQTESQIPGPSEWLGMRSENLSWRNARRHKFAWRGSYVINVLRLEHSYGNRRGDAREGWHMGKFNRWPYFCFSFIVIIELRHQITNKTSVRLAQTQISLGIRYSLHR